MKTTKTLIALGVSCTLGMGAAVAASTPFPVSVDDATPSASHENRISSMITWDTHASHDIGSTSQSAGGSVGDTISSLGSESLSSEDQQLSGLTMDETLALADEGIYSDFYTVSMVPVVVEQWDYYVLSPAADDDFDVISAADSEDVLILSEVSSDDLLILSEADSEDFYVLSPVSYDVIALFPSSSSESEQTSAM